MAVNILADLAYDIPVLGPTGVAFPSLGTTSSQVLAPDNVRHGVIFHNPGSGIIRVAPSNLALVTGVGGILIYPQSEETFFEDDLFRVTAGWNAVSDVAGPQPLTIFNFTDLTSVKPPPEPLARLTGSSTNVSPNGVQISNLTTASQQVIGANPNRRGIVFMNPGAQIAYVCPANLTAVAGAGSMTVLPGGEKRIVAKGRVRVNCAWNAIAAQGSGNSLTILEFL
jgi:hypothetical protein